MERLTARNSDGSVWLPRCFKRCNGNPDDFECTHCDEDYKLVERLATIEDILGDNYDLDHLRELVEADREGRLDVRPPCKVDDAVYVLVSTLTDTKEIWEGKITGFFRGKCRLYVAISYKFSNGHCHTAREFADELGKSVFLSREEAEAALAKMKED